MSREIRLDLDMVPRGVPPVIQLNQYDDDFTIVFTLYSGSGTLTIESGTTASVSGTKPDGTGYSANSSLNVEYKKAIVYGNAQMTAVPGRAIFELTLFKSGKRLSSANFILDVEPAALDADTVISQTTINRFVGLENSISSLAETATTAASNAATSASNAASSASAAASSASSAASAAQTAARTEAQAERGKYITSNSSGIMIAKMDGSNVYTPTNAPSGLENIYIDSDGVHHRDGTTIVHTTTPDGDEQLAVDTNAAASTDDGQLNTALSNTGWGSVITSGLLGLKSTLTKIINRLYWLTQGSQYSVESTTLDNQEITGSAKGFSVSVAKSGKKAIALAGFELGAATTNPANHSSCSFYQIMPTNNFATMQVAIRNTSGSTARVKITVHVLYINTAGD